MKREIKFRVWDKQENKFFEPTYEAYKGNLEDLSVGLNGIVFKRTLSEPSSMIDWQNERWVVNEFTGLLDKNRKEIYEGDILREDRGSIGKVIFINGAFKCQMTHAKYAPWQIYHKKHKFYFEIIGNIYENPELLNQNP